MRSVLSCEALAEKEAPESRRCGCDEERRMVPGRRPKRTPVVEGISLYCLIVVPGVGGERLNADTTPMRVNLGADQRPSTAIQVNRIPFSFRKAANA